MAACVTMSSLRTLTRSAMSPVHGMSRSCGPNWSAMVMPTAAASLSVNSVSTIQS